MGDLNLLGWVVLKSGILLSEKLNIPLAKLCATTEKVTWERLVNIDCQRRIFLSNLMTIDLKNDFLFHMLENKVKYDVSVVMSYLDKNYRFPLLDYKYTVQI